MFFKVTSTLNDEYMEIPDCNVRYRVIRPFRRGDGFIVETNEIPETYISEISASDPAVTTRLAWWNREPSEIITWTEVA